MKINQLLENKLKNYQNTYSNYEGKQIPLTKPGLKLGAALLTGLPLLMLSSEAQAQITNPEPDLCLPGDQTFSNTYFGSGGAFYYNAMGLGLNVDGAGGNDIGFRGYSSFFGGNMEVFDPKGGLNLVGTAFNASRLPYGATISNPIGGSARRLAAFNRTQTSLFGGYYSTNEYGQWLNDPSPGYLGFSFISDVDGMTHNGWVELSVIDFFDPLDPKLTISRYGYNPIADAPIQAGAGAAPTQVPTLSEWGLITLALFLMTFGTVYIGRTQSMIAGSGSTRSIGSVFSKPPFVWSVLKKTLLATAGLAAVAGLITYMVYGSIAAVDILGTAVAGPLLAYLMHLIVVFEKERKK